MKPQTLHCPATVSSPRMPLESRGVGGLVKQLAKDGEPMAVGLNPAEDEGAAGAEEAPRCGYWSCAPVISVWVWAWVGGEEIQHWQHAGRELVCAGACSEPLLHAHV